MVLTSTSLRSSICCAPPEAFAGTQLEPFQDRTCPLVGALVETSTSECVLIDPSAETGAADQEAKPLASEVKIFPLPGLPPVIFNVPLISTCEMEKSPPIKGVAVLELAIYNLLFPVSL